MLVREHEEIVTALKQKNKERVADAMRSHIRNQAEAGNNIIRGAD